MKIKSILLLAVVIALVALFSYYLGSSMQGRHSDQQSIRTPVIETVYYAPAPKDTVAAASPEPNTASVPVPDVSKKTEETEADFKLRKQKIEERYAEHFRVLRENAVIALKKLDYPDNTTYTRFVEQMDNTTTTNSEDTNIRGHTETKETRVIGKPDAAYELKVSQLNKAANDLIDEYRLECQHFERQRACDLSDLEKAKKLAIESISHQTSKEPAQRIAPKAPGTVTGILSSDSGAPLTIINGNVHSEGQTINGVKVVKINRDSVEFEKAGGSHWSQKVNELPSANWP